MRVPKLLCKFLSSFARPKWVIKIHAGWCGVHCISSEYWLHGEEDAQQVHPQLPLAPPLPLTSQSLELGPGMLPPYLWLFISYV